MNAESTTLNRFVSGSSARECASTELKTDVSRLATEIGPRNIYHYEALQKAAAHIETSLREAGYSPLLHTYETQGKGFVNISAELPGREHRDEIVVIAAHYDTHKDSRGANDNGSALAALLELARHFARREGRGRCVLSPLPMRKRRSPS